LSTELTTDNQLFILEQFTSTLTLEFLGIPIGTQRVVQITSQSNGSMITRVTDQSFLDILLPADTYAIRVLTDTYATINDAFMLAGDMTLTLNFVSLGLRKRFIVIDQNSVTVNDALVSIGGQSVTTNDMGIAEFILQPGQYNVSVAHDDYSVLNNSQFVADDLDVTLQLDEKVYLTYIEVLDQAKHPVRDFQLVLNGEICYTNVHGLVKWRGLRGTYPLEFTYGGNVTNQDIDNPSYLQILLYEGFEYELNFQFGPAPTTCDCQCHAIPEVPADGIFDNTFDNTFE
jgi:hypothetical protein